MNTHLTSFRRIFFWSCVLLLAGSRPAKACGYVEDSYHYFNLFVPEWIFDQAYSPTFYTSEAYHHIWDRQDYSQANLQRWQQLLGRRADEQLLEKILYGRFAPNYESQSREALIRNVLFQNSSLPIAEQQAYQQYLLLSLQLEKLSDQPADPWQRSNANSMPAAGQQELLNQLLQQYERNRIPELKARYAFQILKAYRYSGQPEQAIQWYEKELASAENKSMIDYWAMDHYAGLLLGQEDQQPQGYYHFLKVFQNCPSRRHSAYYSLDIATQENWDATLALCESREKKALLHFIRGSKSDVLALEDMQAIFGLLGNHPWLQILTARELNKLESRNFEYFTEQPIDNLLTTLEQDGSLLKNKEYRDYAGRLLRFVTTAHINNRKDGFWGVAKGYLEFMTGKLPTARLTLEELGELPESYRRIQRELLLAIDIIQAETITTEMENRLATEITEVFNDETTQWHTEQNNQEFILDLLAYRLEQQGEPVLASLLRRRMLNETKADPQPAAVDTLIALVNQPRHTQLELLALKHFMGNKTPWKSFLLTSTEQLHDMSLQLLDLKGRLLMREPEKLEEAIAILDSLPARFDFRLEHNPFNAQINDCIWDPDCQPRTSARYTRDSFAQKLLDIRQLAQQDNSAMDYYLLGNAYYNMTYFGPAWYVINHHRSGSYYTGYTDCSAALEFYQKAMELATDEELAAKACFMAAKAEQNLYLMRLHAEGGDWWGQFTIKDWGDTAENYERYQANIRAAGYRTYFQRLRERYAETAFYERAVGECKYLEYYVSRS